MALTKMQRLQLDGAATAERDRLRAGAARMEASNLDMANTIGAIADPDDYETGDEKTVETCRRLASECMARNNL